jgi:hypothetical protein
MVSGRKMLMGRPRVLLRISLTDLIGEGTMVGLAAGP